MKATIEDIRDSFKIGYEAFEASKKEANEVWDLFHNRHYTSEQLAILSNRGQPAETFNVVKMFARMLVGYYSTVVNTVVISPANPRDTATAVLLNDIVNFVFEDNRFDIEGDKIKLGGLLTGILASYTSVIDTGKVDSFGRPIYKVKANYVPESELVLDPASVADDYSDAEFLHRFRWFSEAKVLKTYGKEAMEKLTAYYNFLDTDESDFEFNYGNSYTGYFKVFDNYLIVHTVMEDDKGKRWFVAWSGDVELARKEITLKECRWPYRVQKLHSSDKTEYYGVFREIIESQKAINQAILKIQLMVNSEKAFVEAEAVDNIDDFKTSFNRVNAVIEVKSLAGIKIEYMSAEVKDQYIILDNALDRIQRVLGINDSFLGMAFASDSGRKVKLQQNQTVMSLRYVTARIEAFYRSLGEDIANLVKQYYSANQVLAIADETTGQRWVELNKPMMEFAGRLDEEGNPVYQPVLLPEVDPANGEIMETAEGDIILAPVPEADSEIAFTEFQLKIESSSYNDEDEKAQLLLETVMSGQVGQMLSQVNPAGFFTMSALAMKSMKTKYSPDIVRVLNETAAMLGQDPAASQQASEMAQGGSSQQPKSATLKLPQNTNEGVG